MSSRYLQDKLFTPDSREPKLQVWARSLIADLRGALRTALRQQEEAEISRDLSLVVAGERIAPKEQERPIMVTLPDGAEFPLPAGSEIEFIQASLNVTVAAQGGIRIDSGSGNIHVTPISQFEVRVFAKDKE